jgi:hypothetical protein
LDFDSTGFVGKFRVTVAWLILKILSRNRQYVRKSANKGWHLKAHGLPISFKVSLFIRILLGDDRMRVKFDIRRQKKPKAILWTHKDGKSAGKWSKNLMGVIR